ncbi:hypothetical protein T492DRAFT_873882 [Pavlovales sp. CCMP2436]|nr:hypothetical protein T492DRAFT_873882 [Pavlovales sp. CCMP2436]
MAPAQGFALDFPEVLDEKLRFDDALYQGFVVCAAFNRRGTLLATGCRDGRVLVFAWDTHSVARDLSAHTVQIAAVGWSRDGQAILSADQSGSPLSPF